MSRLSNFILPLIGAVGVYFLIGIVLPDLNPWVALTVALVTGYTLRWALQFIQTKTSTATSK